MSVPSVNQQVSPDIQVKEIKDTYLRRNFQSLVDYFKNQNQLLNFKFFDLTFTAAQSGYKLKHGLGYVPQDLIVLRATGTGTVSINYGLSDNTNLYLDISGACRVRFFAGSYWQQADSTVNKTDIAKISASSSSQQTNSPSTLATSTTLTANSGLVLLTNASSLQTLPSAKGIGGTSIRFKHRGTSYSQFHTIKPASGDTIEDSPNNIILYARNEYIELTSDNVSNWLITNRVFNTSWAIISDQRQSGTVRGTITGGSWQTMTIQTLTGGAGGFVSVDGVNNQFTLQPGKYFLTCSAAGGVRCNHVRVRYQNVTDGTTIAVGTNQWSDLTDADGSVIATALAYIELTSAKTFEMQMRTQSSAGMLASSFGENEIYSQILIQKRE